MNRIGEGIVLAVKSEEGRPRTYWTIASLGRVIVEDNAAYTIVDAEGVILKIIPKAQAVAVLLPRGQGYILHQRLRLT